MYYDYLIVGAGLYGAVFACEAHKRGKKCLVIERRPHVAGNLYTKRIEDIDVHMYGPHIFHTSSKRIWDYVGQFGEFNNFINSPIARWHDEIYNLPFNMNTFYQMWGVLKPNEAKEIIERQKSAERVDSPRNLEEQAINMVGRDIYERLIKGYTEKQWGRKCTELPPFIIKRLPVRFNFDNNYFSDCYQGIPVDGYTSLIERMLDGVEVRLGIDFNKNKNELEAHANKTLYTGSIDSYFNYVYGPLAYRTVRFETELLTQSNYQGCAVVNYTDGEIPYTRIIEHKHFKFGMQPKTVISREYPSEWQQGDEPYYPVRDDINLTLYAKYKELSDLTSNIIFGGRLGKYQYYDMDDIIEDVLSVCEKEFS